jgi:FkbH-like protein/FkbM family methyltransferase
MNTAPREATALKWLVSLTRDRSGAACAEFRIGVRSDPYLADHGFQDMVVLAGSFYLEMARCVDRELTQRLPRVIRNVTFHSPVILGPDDTVIRVDVRNLGDGRVGYGFYEASDENGDARQSTRQYAATLEIDRHASATSQAGMGPFTIAGFQARARSVVDSDRFYTQLRRNGNQYGPSFQRVVSVWRAGNQSLAWLAAERRDGEREPPGLEGASLLDGMTQVLASIVMDRGQTFILQSIDQVAVTDSEFPERLWGHAVLQHENDAGQQFVGTVRVVDQSARPCVELSGVSFAFLERVNAPENAGTSFVIASNFTADPIEDSLKFWGDHFHIAVQVEFAPYDQIFQQLLDTHSAFHKNRDGVNILLLSLEEWAVGDGHGNDAQRGDLTLTTQRADRCFGDRTRYVLPNGLEIVHLNRYETDYVYKEIFEDQCYVRHGIRLPDGATVVDIGANIGLFSLFVLSRSRHAKIFAFEPAPLVYDCLKANCDAYGSNVRAFNLGVSDEPKTATFTFYEKSSVFSGFHADEVLDGEAIRTVVRNTLNTATAVDDESVEAFVDELTADRLSRSTQECRVTSVSDIIRENQIDRIDLLKIDAEKSEWDIIRGIDERDWPRIDQLVIEIHDRTREAVARIEQLLLAKGYRCAVDEERLLEDSGLFNLYATRDAVQADSTTNRPRSVGSLERNVRDLLAALRQFMQPESAPVVLCVAPRTLAAADDAELNAALDGAEERLLADAGTVPNVHTIRSAAVRERYPVKDYSDPHGRHIAHIPYTTEGYAAIGTSLFRAIVSLKRKPFKVIVLDCDQTLWKGVCGEDGPLGIDVSTPYRRLQEFMVDQTKAGLLLCLCSKNNERDVLDVFDQRADMALKREHLVSWRVNWSRKSDNVTSLAEELNLGLDSFIFIDDNPVDCADVRINCPGVLTLQLPSDVESFPAFLDHVWAFDHARATGEDQHRTRMYQENAAREKLRGQILSLKDFIDGLELRIEIGEMTDDQLGRVSQLTFRTNQFNFTTVRRSEQDIRTFLARANATCLVVRVLDRFGDYGLVGVVIYERAADRYKVDTFLLSCRVLGRGVEHTVLADLGRRAVTDARHFVELDYRPSNKNAPARDFITSLGEPDRTQGETSWTFAADRLARLEYNPDQAPTHPSAKPASTPTASNDSARPSAEAGATVEIRSEPLQHIADRLTDIDRIASAIEAFRGRHEPIPEVAVDIAPRGSLQTALLDIWRKVLGRPRIGLTDNFFEVGGTSLRAVQVIALIKKELKRTLSIVTLFECPTVTLLAAKLSAASGGPDDGASTTEAAHRGQRRRNVVRRMAS